MTAARPPAALPRRWRPLERGFRRWVRGYLAAHFHALRRSRGALPQVPPDRPLIVVLNHPGWWDPLVGMALAGEFPERTHYAPMEARALARYTLFDRLGFYGVELGTVRGASAFCRTTAAILRQPRTAVWITAQGRFTDPRVRPPGLRTGIGHVARGLTEGVILPLALEYPFWNERFPEALAHFGAPIRIGDNPGLSTSAWVARLDAGLAAAQDTLAAIALGRDPAVFETLIAGKTGVGGLYDQWRRLLAWRTAARFEAAHGVEGERS